MNITEINTEELIAELEKRGYIRVLWHEDDIRDAAETMEVDITDDQIKEVKSYLEDYFDANTGITWYTINNAIENII